MWVYHLSAQQRTIRSINRNNQRVIEITFYARTTAHVNAYRRTGPRNQPARYILRREIRSARADINVVSNYMRLCDAAAQTLLRACYLNCMKDIPARARACYDRAHANPRMSCALSAIDRASSSIKFDRARVMWVGFPSARNVLGRRENICASLPLRRVFWHAAYRCETGWQPSATSRLCGARCRVLCIYMSNIFRKFRSHNIEYVYLVSICTRRADKSVRV